MFKIISGTPFYVWILLVYLVWGGWKSRKTYTISWKTLLIMPAVMFAWSLSATFSQSVNLSTSCLWAGSMALGVWLGSLTTRKLSLRFDKHFHLLEVSGSWVPMILSVSIFSLRYFLGVIQGLHPELSGHLALQPLQHTATLVSGMFLGRLVGYWQQSKKASHVDLGQ